MVCDILDRFNIVGKKDLYPNQLSGGQQQLVAVARAVIANPKVILADEPTGNLHSSQGREIMELFKKLNDAGTTIVQVTHSETNAGYGSRVIELKDGWIGELMPRRGRRRLASLLALSVATLVGAANCSPEAPAKRYTLQGQILGVSPGSATRSRIAHGDMPGLMPGMTMTYPVASDKLIDGRKLGEIVTATLEVSDSTGRLTEITHAGEAAAAREFQRRDHCRFGCSMSAARFPTSR